jgi:multimeric flavodoxin WrbA
MRGMRMAKVLAVNGSPRRDGNIDAMMRVAEEVLAKHGIDVERVCVADYEIRPCDACDDCHEDAWSCPIEDDAITLVRKMVAADAIIIGSPVYFGGVTAQLKALFDRSVMAYQGSELKDKIGVALSCGGAAHGGQELTVSQIVVYFLMHGMRVATSANGAFGAMAEADGKGDVVKDDEGLESVRLLAERVVELLKA